MRYHPALTDGHEPSLRIALSEYRLDSRVAPLVEGEIQLWYRRLACSPSDLDYFRGLLAPDERHRAARFRFDTDRDHYVIGRGTLRTLLGTYSGNAAGDLRFSYSQYGKPSLEGAPQARAIQFNLSHSGKLALFAFTLGRRIGVDVEQIRRDFNTEEIAERYFSAAERAVLRKLGDDQRHEAFFRCWTCKEAFIKALGEGLSHPLDRFDVSLAPGEPVKLRATRPDPQEASRWSLWNIDVPEGYAASLAAEADPGSGTATGHPGNHLQ